MENTFEKIYSAVKQIPMGKVSTYGEIAKYCGIKNSRIVGYALHSNKNPIIVPCHRVVTKNGRLSNNFKFGGLSSQKNLLLNEGVSISGDFVDLSKHLFIFNNST